MGELSDKTKGLGNGAAGQVKQAVGEVTKDSRMRAEGVAQELKGKAQKRAGTIKGALGDKI